MYKAVFEQVHAFLLCVSLIIGIILLIKQNSPVYNNQLTYIHISICIMYITLINLHSTTYVLHV